jgi:predicted NBD/HSP70 family sugar kinase
MYVGIDIGGSKTLIGVLNEHGVILESHKFPTAPNYEEFLADVANTVDAFTTDDFRAASVGIAVTHLDRAHGIGKDFGNLPWRDITIKDDIEDVLHCPVIVENDAKLACLSEAMVRKDRSKILYVTVSTGIGYALVTDQKIDTNIGDGGGRLILQPFNGKLVPWESFASGSAIVRRYGKRAADITDAKTWQRIAFDLSGGLLELIAITEPDVIVFGGSVGTYFERLKPHLEAELTKHQTPLLIVPPLEQAKRPEEAVLYGCYDLIQEVYGRNRQHSHR